jgi:hypothetical protein
MPVGYAAICHVCAYGFHLIQRRNRGVQLGAGQDGMLGSGRGCTDVDRGLPGRIGPWSLLGPKVLFSVDAKVVNVELVGSDAVQCA